MLLESWVKWQLKSSLMESKAMAKALPEAKAFTHSLGGLSNLESNSIKPKV